MIAALLTVGVTAETSKPALYRIFLDQGDDLIAYGDYARVGDRVVFALPVSLEHVGERAQLVSIPSARVDWTTTDRYADAVRASRYASTRGDIDFARLSADVARVLNDIAFSDDGRVRTARARDTRRRLIAWANNHYGYRADDIVEIVALLDTAIEDAEDSNDNNPLDRREREELSLHLVASTAHAPSAALLPHPTLQEIVARVLGASTLTPVPAERISLLRAAIAVLDEPNAELEPMWRFRTRAAAEADLAAELHTNETYAQLSQTALDRATAYAADADVRGVQSVLSRVREEDLVLGRRRPNQLEALLATLEFHLEHARALRLDRDGRALRAEVLREYQRDVSAVVDIFTDRRPMLDDIRLLAGPDVGSLPTLSAAFTDAASQLADVSPPDDAKGVHRVMAQALGLASSAAWERYQAVQDRDLHGAWDAAAAAAGALMLFDRATEELDLVLQP